VACCAACGFPGARSGAGCPRRRPTRCSGSTVPSACWRSSGCSAPEWSSASPACNGRFPRTSAARTPPVTAM